jgi:hypothetical protein
MSNPRSASNAWAKIKNKLIVPNPDGTSPAPTPKRPLLVRRLLPRRPRKVKRVRNPRRPLASAPPRSRRSTAPIPPPRRRVDLLRRMRVSVVVCYMF